MTGTYVYIGVILVLIIIGRSSDSSKKPHVVNRIHDKPNKTDQWSVPILGQGLTEGSNWDILRKQVFARDKGKCTSCGSNINLTVDHIQELSLGGSNELDNLRTLCAECHQDRHRKKFLERGFDADDNYGENYQASPKVIALNKAMKSGEGLGIKYVDAQGLYSERVIYPKDIYKNKHVYVDAYCELDSAIRVFRVSRMKPCLSRLNFYNNSTNSYTSTWDPNDKWVSGGHYRK